ncbi:unnamed protein product, partial [Dicrocoelium dendriticum]
MPIVPEVLSDLSLSSTMRAVCDMSSREPHSPRGLFTTFSWPKRSQVILFPSWSIY